MLLGDTNGIVKPVRGKPSILDHKPLENYLGRYSGLMLYLKEMDEGIYGKLCAVCPNFLFPMEMQHLLSGPGIFLCGKQLARYSDQGIPGCV